MGHEYLSNKEQYPKMVFNKMYFRQAVNWKNKHSKSFIMDFPLDSTRICLV
jgi:hypothetical protein